MSHQSQIARNPRLLFWARAFIEIKAMTAVIVLFYLHRGVTMEQVFWLSIIWSLTALITEVPSGYLADRIGRKRTLLLGAGLLGLMHVGDWFAFGFWQFVPVFIIMSSAFSFFSGTEEAMLYESLVELGQEDQMTQKNGRLFSARSIFKMFIPLVGAWIAQDILEWQFKLLIGVNALALAIAVACLLQLREPRHKKEVLASEVGIFRESLNTIRREPWLLRVALNRLIVFVAIFVAWRINQPLLEGKGLAVVWLGVFDLFTHILIFFGGWYLGRLEARWGAQNLLFLTAVVTALCLFVAGLSENVWVLFTVLDLAIGIGSAREPIFAHLINRHVLHRSRATTLSNLNVIKSVLDIPVLLLAGWLTTQDLQWPLFLGVSLCVLAILVFPVRQKDSHHSS